MTGINVGTCFYRKGVAFNRKHRRDRKKERPGVVVSRGYVCQKKQRNRVVVVRVYVCTSVYMCRRIEMLGGREQRVIEITQPFTYGEGYRERGGNRERGLKSGKLIALVVSLTCDLARSSKCRHTCFASRSGQLSRGYNWRIWPTPRNRTEHNTRINTLV